MTQLERAKAAANKLLRNSLDEEALRDLRRVLDAAQNAPPHGEADGSLYEEAYDQFRKLDGLFAQVRQTVNKLKSLGRERAL